ncbi:MAG: S-layer homology domain-containing protein [Bacteroidota bacterium]
MEQLNKDFRGTNSDRYYGSPEFRHLVTDTRIAFCLATVDPMGRSTTGILRHNYRRPSYNYDYVENTIKMQTAWDRKKYLNVWVVDFPEYAGYAYYPGTLPPDIDKWDGVVVATPYVGSMKNPSPISARYEGRVVTHEVGHWLNLIHILGEMESCSSTDLVSDTPAQSRPTHCHNNRTCGTNDMVGNHMDYGDCSNMFTHGQRDRMRSALFGNYRNPIRSSNGCSRPTPSRGVPYDVIGNWAEFEIKYMIDYGFMSGYSDNSFKPDRLLTRAEFATMLVKVLRPTPSSNSAVNTRNFHDINGHWARNNILEAARAGYLSGYPDGSFRPNNRITKLEVNAAVSNIGITGGSALYLNALQDSGQIPSWGESVVYRSIANELLACHPDTKFYNGNSSSTRANAVVVLYQALRYLNRVPRHRIVINPYLVSSSSLNPSPDVDKLEDTVPSENLEMTSITSLYPNPAKDILYIASMKHQIEEQYFEIYELASGRKVQSGKIFTEQGINVQQLVPGVHLLRLHNTVSNTVVTERFVKN